MNRTELWKRANALYAAYWPGRPTLTTPTVAAMEEAGLSRHAPEAVLCAVKLAGAKSKHPPSVAELLELLEGRTVRVPIPQRDVWGRAILDKTGARVLSGEWTTEREEPEVAREMRRAAGLPPASPVKALGYRPHELDRPESDGEPRPKLPAEVLARAGASLNGPERPAASGKATPSEDRHLADRPDPRAAKSSPGASGSVYRQGADCPACGHGRNGPSWTVCAACGRARR